MERLDSDYAAHALVSKDKSKTAEERAEAGEKLALREKEIQPGYKALALLYADLHEYVHICGSVLLEVDISFSRVGRMEAKGCAKPAVWREARRFFYWALRARLARSGALAQFSEANGHLSLEERTQLLEALLPSEQPTAIREVAEMFEALDLSTTLAQIRGDYLARRFVELALADRTAVVEGLERLRDRLTSDEKNALIAALSGSTVEPPAGTGLA